MNSQVTIRDVAEAAGFSVNTVSRALNDKPDVSRETKRTILETARKLGYRPNKLARGLRSNKTQTIGVIVADIANPYFGALVKGTEAEARKYGYSVILQNTDEKYERELEAIQVMQEEQVEGIILSPTQKEKGSVEYLNELGIPFVLAGRRFLEPKTDYVVTDDVQGGFLATEHLIQLGHTRISIINGPLHISSARERLEGYRMALNKYKIKADSSLIMYGAVTMEDGYSVARSLLQQVPRVTAIFAFSDFVAFGVLRAIREAGLKVPEDVSVVGYDDNQFAACAEVPLTTVRISTMGLGISAVRALNEKLQNRHKTVQIELPVELVVRQSSGTNKLSLH